MGATESVAGAAGTGAGADASPGAAAAWPQGGGTGDLFPREPGSVPPPASPLSDEEELAQAAHDDVKLLAEAARFATPLRVQQVLEALLFAAEKPLDLDALHDTTRFSKEQLLAGLASLKERYAPSGSSGIVLADLGARFQLRTDPQVGQYVRRMLQVKPMRLTRAALETLSMVAYRQPITRPELEELRGVDCGAVTKALLERKLVRILGKKDEPGRPLLYGTSKEFLELFNLRDLTQLPTLREFQELSEESRKIVEEEAPDAPKVQGLVELAHDPALEQKMAAAAHESDAALAQLEKAMAAADEQAKTAAAVLAPPVDPNAPPGAPPVAGPGAELKKAGTPAAAGAATGDREAAVDNEEKGSP